MGKRKALKFRIGDKVEVDFLRDEVVANYTERNRVYENSSTVGKQGYKSLCRNWELKEDKKDEGFGYTLPKDIRLGVITGIKVMCEGWHYQAEAYTPGYNSMYPDDPPDPGGLEVVKTHYLWCVRSGYANKEHYFFEEDIKIVVSSDEIPFKDTGWNSSMADKGRADMSRWSKDFPRDSKGRWSK